ncbi:MAG: hypothetical protein R8K22_02530 [Mariprofundaceae bacterium]
MKFMNKFLIVAVFAMMVTAAEDVHAFALNNGNVNQPASASSAANEASVKHVMFAKIPGSGLLFMPQLRYQTTSITDNANAANAYKVDTKSFGISLNLAYDIDDTSFGVILPYDRITRDFTEPTGFNDILSSVKDSRYGIIGFAKHAFQLDGGFSVTPSLMLSSLADKKKEIYRNPTTLNKTKGSVTTNSYGINTAFGYSQEAFQISFAIGYQYSKDNSGTVSTIDSVTPWDKQKLLRIGAKGVFQLSPQFAVGANAVWNSDSASFLKDNKMSKTYTNLGFDVTYMPNDQFGVTLGYTGLAGYTRASSSAFHLGANWEF